MGFLLGFFGVIAGFLAIVLMIYVFIRKMLNQNGFAGRSIKSICEEAKAASLREENTHKQVSGMTSIYLPLIRQDFNDFNLDEFYLKVEKSLRAIFEALENKNTDYLNDSEYNIINQKIKLQIEDLIHNDITYKYDDIVFHNHSIKRYQKKNEVISLEISSSLEYYYEEYKGDKVIYKKDYKKQARYLTKFVYIIDAEKAGFDIKILGLNCPNCGSPVKTLNQLECAYCGSGLNIEIADLQKIWKIVSYEEN